MAYTDFQDFLSRLEREGELKRISVPVDPYLEITRLAANLPPGEAQTWMEV